MIYKGVFQNINLTNLKIYKSLVKFLWIKGIGELTLFLHFDYIVFTKLKDTFYRF